MTLEGLILTKNIKSYVELTQYFKSLGIKGPNEEETKHIFEKIRQSKTVEKRPTSKRRTKATKQTVKRNSSTSTGRSKPRADKGKSNGRPSRRKEKNN